MRRIVVGVDGSETSLEALRWAASEMMVHNAQLSVVTAWDVPVVGLLLATPSDVESFLHTAEVTLRDAVTGAFGPAKADRVK